MDARVFPSPNGQGEVIWNGRQFEGYGSVLSYPMPCRPEGWNDALTDFHEEVSQGRHPIDEASFSSALERVKLRGRKGEILEIGCSSGYFLERLLEWNPSVHITGVDIIDQPLHRLANRLTQKGQSVPLLRFDMTSCPLPDNSYNIVVALNVLEHIEDDEIALSEIHRILKPGGSFVFEVPAGPALYDDYDRELHHYRRYRAEDLEKLLKTTGFKKIELNHLGFFMYPAFYAVKKWRSMHFSSLEPFDKKQMEKGSTNAKLIQASGSSFFKILFAWELWLGKRVRYPTGIRCCGIFSKA